LFGIEYPIVQAGMGMGSSAALAAAVSNAGALGSLGVWRRPPEDLDAQLALIKVSTKVPAAPV
jgi:nitronate monooxygenase/enoyl-[acyl-carrier protein] reductase II